MSIGIWKGVGVNLGAAALFVPSLRGDDEIGRAPSRPTDAFGGAVQRRDFSESVTTSQGGRV
jgi:hypothetical protein